MSTKPQVIQINVAHVVAEVTAAFYRYEQALGTNDVQVLDELFWDSPLTLRYGATENLYGHGEIATFRSARSSVGLARKLIKVVITTYGNDFGTANCEFERGGKRGRQSHTWVRTSQGWRIVAAHVSMLAEPSPPA